MVREINERERELVMDIATVTFSWWEGISEGNTILLIFSFKKSLHRHTHRRTVLTDVKKMRVYKNALLPPSHYFDELKSPITHNMHILNLEVKSHLTDFSSI